MNSEMYEGSACFSLDFSSMETAVGADQLQFDHHQHLINMEIDQQNQLINNSHHQHHHLNWTTYPHDQQHYQQAATSHAEIGNNNDYLPNMPLLTPTPPPQDFLNLFHLPRCSNASISFSNLAGISEASGQVMYEPPQPFNLTPQPPFFGELVHDLPTRDVDIEGELVTGNKGTKHFTTTEKHRRQQLNEKYETLKNLVPIPSKPDRASIVKDAIDYINELKRTVEELKILVERKRCYRGRSRTSTRPNGGGDPAPDQQGYNDTLRSSWLQRKSKHTEVDVRIIDDEVTIKLVQQKKFNCLLSVSKALDELQLDLHHVTGGLIGDFYSYLFNTKICEGSSVYASAIANKLIEVVDAHYATNSATNSH